MEGVTARLMLKVIFNLLCLRFVLQFSVAAKIGSNLDETENNFTSFFGTLDNTNTAIQVREGDKESELQTTISLPGQYATTIGDATEATIQEPVTTPKILNTFLTTTKSFPTVDPTRSRTDSFSETETSSLLINSTWSTEATTLESSTTPTTLVTSKAIPTTDPPSTLANNTSTTTFTATSSSMSGLSSTQVVSESTNDSSTTTAWTTISTTSTVATKQPVPPDPPIKTCNQTKVGNYTLPETSAGSWAIPEGIICLNKDNTPVRILCQRNGTWNVSEAKLSCPQDQLPQITQDLYSILDKNDPVRAMNKTSNLIKKNKEKLKAIDVHFMAQILRQASADDEIVANPEQFIETIDRAMDIEKKVLASSQELLNATDSILDSLDQLLTKRRNTSLRTPHLFVETIEKSDEKIGAMITKTPGGNNFNTFNITYLDKNGFYDTLLKRNFEIAFVVFPETETVDRYFITIFYNDNFFNNKENPSRKVGSWIISILFPTTVAASIKIYYKEFETSWFQQCDHWKYGIENREAIPGAWKSDGNATEFKQGFYVCEVNHTTHFGLLVTESSSDSIFLDAITIFGLVLSLLGIIVILLTALVFKQWRNKTNTKIILNVSFCLLLLILLFLLFDKIEQGSFCKVVGILLHYIVLAHFCWSLTISYSSYHRLQMVSHDQIKHVLLKFCGFSWGLPIIAVIATVTSNIETYDKNNDKKICYPKDSYLQLGVCLPMVIILLLNTIIYLLIAKKLLMTKLDIQKHKTKRALSVQKFLLLLFFMMGFTWAFGVVVAFTDNEIFLYLFCATATVHGFIMFVFYILDSGEIKRLWKNKLKQISTKSKRREKINERQNHRIEENLTESSSG